MTDSTPSPKPYPPSPYIPLFHSTPNGMVADPRSLEVAKRINAQYAKETGLPYPTPGGETVADREGVEAMTDATSLTPADPTDADVIDACLKAGLIPLRTFDDGSPAHGTGWVRMAEVIAVGHLRVADHSCCWAFDLHTPAHTFEVEVFTGLEASSNEAKSRGQKQRDRVLAQWAAAQLKGLKP